MRPNFSAPLQQSRPIFLRRGDLQRAFDEINIALSLNTGANRYTNLLQSRPRADVAQAIRTRRSPISPKASRSIRRPQIPATAASPIPRWASLDEALADCNEVLAQHPKSFPSLARRGNVYRAKGDLDAALKDYNEALKLSPNFVRAYASRGQVYEKRRTWSPRVPTIALAGAALTKVDEIETTLARRFAKERLAALSGLVRPRQAGPPAETGGGAPAGPRKVALIVGNGAYKNVQKLANPPRDAKLIAITFRDLGFATVTLAPDLTRDQFFAALRDFGREAEKADWAVVYYAGHGMEIGGVNYLIPTDAKLAADRDAETQAVALEQVIAAVSGARKLRLVMLDACRDNPFEKNMQQTIALKLVNKGLSNIEPEAGFMVVYAAKHGETALDGDAVNSPFATALAREIKVPKVEVRKLFDIVRDDVWKATNRQQQPFTYGSLPGREDFYFVAEK